MRPEAAIGAMSRIFNETLISMIASYKKQSNQMASAFAVILVLIVVLVVLQGRQTNVSKLLALAGGVCFFWSCWALIKAKGRTGWWLLAPIFLNWVGAFIIFCMKDLAPDDAQSQGISAPGEEALPDWARTK
jgi:glycerol uptake facilitator-like aquaporin